MPPKRGRRLIKKKQPEPEPEPETPTAATQQPVEQAPARGKKQTNNDEMETDQQIIQEVVNETIENLKDASDAKNTGDAEMEESSLLDQDDSENAENDAIENAKPETENTGENPAENSTAEDATTEQDEIITVSGESASQFYELSWKDQSDPEENIAKAASVAYLETQSRTNQAIFIAANVKSLNHLVKLKNNFDVETYILACKYFSFAKEYCDLVISVSDYNKSVGQIYAWGRKRKNLEFSGRTKIGSQYFSGQFLFFFSTLFFIATAFNFSVRLSPNLKLCCKWLKSGRIKKAKGTRLFLCRVCILPGLFEK